jgi:flavorubredoxin
MGSDSQICFACNGGVCSLCIPVPIGAIKREEVCQRDKEARKVISNEVTGTRVDEVASGIYRISTPLDVIPGGFTFNSYLVADDEPLLFHTSYRKLFPSTLEAIEKLIPIQKLRWIGGSHFEGDEFGALNDLLAAAPAATPFGAEVGVLISLNDFSSRPARGLVDGEEFSIGSRRMKWLYTPHVPHGWDCGILFDLSTKTLFCGDLFTQPGANPQPVTESEVLTASEEMRGMMDYYAHATSTSATLERLAGLQPSMLACQHGSAYRGNSAALLRELSATIERGSGKLPAQ